MHASRPILTFALFACLSLAPSAGAAGGLNVCALLTAKQVTSIKGVSSKCANSKPTPGPGSKMYVGNWAGATSTSPTAQITVDLYTDPGALKVAQGNLAEGFSGTPVKVKGIGDGAYAATGDGTAAMHVSVGKYIVIVAVTSTGKAPSLANVEALAKPIVAKL